MINWDICTLSKDKGGLGLTKVKDTNFALLTKWLWRYYQEPNSLWRKVIDAKYRKDFIGSIPTTGKYCSSNAPWVAIHKAKTGLTLRSLGLQTVETPSLFGIVIGPMIPCLPIECQDYLPSQRVKKLLLKMLGIQLPMIGIFGQGLSMKGNQQLGRRSRTPFLSKLVVFLQISLIGSLKAKVLIQQHQQK